jgi:hypothetical protein
MAVSMFAADVSAKVHIEGSLLNVADGNVKALAIGHKNQPWNPDLALSANGDKAGASVSFVTGAAEDALDKVNFDVVAQNYSIWFKPFDMLKVTVGQYAVDMNQETIDWSNTDTKVEKQGFGLDLNVDAFFATVFFAPEWGNYWFADKEIKDFYFKAGYAADFGRIQAMFRLPKTDNILAGLGYNNTFGSVNMFTNVLFGTNTAVDNSIVVRGELFASTGIDAFGISAFIAGGYWGEGARANPQGNNGLTGWHVGGSYYLGDRAATLGATLKLTYALDGVTPYLYFKCGDFMADTLALQIKPGATGSVGTMGWELACVIDVNGDAVKVDVPVIFTVNF